MPISFGIDIFLFEGDIKAEPELAWTIAVLVWEWETLMVCSHQTYLEHQVHLVYIQSYVEVRFERLAQRDMYRLERLTHRACPTSHIEFECKPDTSDCERTIRMSWSML